MYHISEDIRAQQSARRICEAVMASAGKKPFPEITVAELHRDYLISRTTFYRLFDNTVDVLEYMVDKMGREILLKVRGNSPREVTINAIAALKERRELIELLSSSGHLSLFLKKQEEYLPLSKLAERLDLGESYAYFHGILAQIVPTAMGIWARDGMEDSPEEVYEKLCGSIRMLGVWFSEEVPMGNDHTEKA